MKMMMNDDDDHDDDDQHADGGGLIIVISYRYEMAGRWSCLHQPASQRPCTLYPIETEGCFFLGGGGGWTLIKNMSSGTPKQCKKQFTFHFFGVTYCKQKIYRSFFFLANSLV